MAWYLFVFIQKSLSKLSDIIRSRRQRKRWWCNLGLKSCSVMSRWLYMVLELLKFDFLLDCFGSFKYGNCVVSLRIRYSSTMCFQSRPMCFHNTVLKIYGNLEKEQLVGKNLTFYGFQLRYVDIINV